MIGSSDRRGYFDLSSRFDVDGMLGVADGADGARNPAPAGCFALGAALGVEVAAVGGLGALVVFGTAGLACIGAAVFMVLRG